MARVRIADSRAGFYRFYSNPRQKCKNGSELLVFKRNTVSGVRKNPKPNLGVRFRICLAEKEGFEPSLRLSHTTPLAGEPLRPLGYFSNRKFCRYAKSASTYYHIFFARSIILSVYFKFIFFFRNPYDFKSQSAGLVEVGGLYYFCFLRRL